MPLVKSLPERSSSQATSDGRDEKGREDSPLLVGELPTLEGIIRLQTTMGAGTPEADSLGVSLSREGSLNPEVIASAATCFKRRRITAQVATRPPAPQKEAPATIFPMPQTPALTAKEAVAGTSTGATPREFRDVFSELALRRNLFDFLDLSDEERQHMESLVGGRTRLGEAGL